MIDRKLALAGLMQVGDAPQQGSFDYPFGTIATNNFDTPFVWRTADLPPVDLRAGVDQVETQSYNNCVGEAATTCAEIFTRLRGQPCPELSSLDWYYIARDVVAQMLHIPVEDAGTSAFTAMAAANALGVCTEATWPSTGPVNTRPSDAAYTEALERKVWRYERLGKTTTTMQPDGTIKWATRDLAADILVALASRIPVVVCLPLSEKFFDIKGPMETHPAQGGLSWINAPDYVGSHAMAVTGARWVDGSWLMELENSYGPQWGDGGWFGIRLSELVNRAFDVFAIRNFAGVGSEIDFSLYRFTEGAWGQVYCLYRAALGRYPDRAGLEYWVGVSGQITLEDMATSFMASPEFQSKYGALDNAAFVNLLYENVLGRAADAGGLAFWVGDLDAGRISRAGVLVGFSESDENKQRA